MTIETANFVRRRANDTTVYDSPASKSVASLLDQADATPNSPISHEVPSPPDSDVHVGRSDPISQTEFLDAITNAAATIKPQLEDLPPSLESEYATWIDLHGIDPDNDAVDQIVARQAVFHLLLKTTLCEAKTRRQPADLSALQTNPREALKTASDRFETPVLEPCILDSIGWLADDADLAAVLDLRTQLLESSQPAADIGRLYERLTPKDSRHTLGQYRTRPDHGTLMRRWTTSNDTCLLDPGIGAAILSTPDHPGWITGDEHEHVIGIDRSPLAALMAATSLTLHGQSHDLHVADYMDLSPEDLAERTDGATLNAPYTRYSALPADYRAELKTQIADKTDVEISGKPPLYVFFILHTRQFLSAGDRAAFLSEEAFLGNNHGVALREHLLSEYDIAALIQFNPEQGSAFDGADATGVITLVEATEDDDPSGPIKCIRVDGEPSPGTLLDAVRNEGQENPDWGVINQVRQEELTAERNWRRLVDPPEIDVSGLTPLSELADVKRGPTTGKNEFFCLSEDEVTEYGLDKSYLSPMVPSPKHIQGYDFREADLERAREEGTPVWVLYHVDDIPDASDSERGERDDESAIQQYLQVGVDEHGLDESQTAGARSPWYWIRRREPTPVLVNYWSRGETRFILNETDARHINNLLGFCNLTLSEVETKALLAYLNSGVIDEVLRQHQRSFAGGRKKIEPNDVEKVPVIDPRTLDEDRLAALADEFDALRETARNDERSAEVIERIDHLILQEL